MKNNPLVSIMIPVFNRETLIRDTVQSAIDQTYQNVEVVVVDNASTDKTWEIVQELANYDSRIRGFRNPTNVGPVRNWRSCLDRAKGELANFLWSDDLLHPRFLEKTVPYLQDETVGLAYSAAKIFEEDLKNGRDVFLKDCSGLFPAAEFINDSLLGNGPVSPGCAVMRLNDLRSKLVDRIPNRLGTDTQENAIGPDLLLLMMTAADYPNVGIVAEPLAYFRDHAGSITTSSAKAYMAFHYDSAKAYFVDSFAPELRPRLGVTLLLHSWTYRKSQEYSTVRLRDYFADGRFRLDLRVVSVLVIQKLGRVFREMRRSLLRF